MKPENEIWQVQTRDGVYQADLPTLKQWVAEGVVRPTDRVRKGALNWIEAGRAPLLRRVFSGEECAEPAAQPATTVQPAATVQQTATARQASPDLGLAGGEPFFGGAPSLSSACHFHPSQAATLVCRACGTTFCRACPNGVGTSNVLLCALCDGFCDPLEILNERLALYERQGEGFGLADFATALRYPFRHLASLVGGALMYGFLLLAGMRGYLIALGLVFGCITLIVKRVAYGDLKRDFLPDFSEFSPWDDLVVPCALGFGVTVVTLGPALLLAGALLFGWLGAPPSPAATPGADALDAARAVAAQQQQQVQLRERLANGKATDEDLRALNEGAERGGEGVVEDRAGSDDLERQAKALTPSAQMAREMEAAKQDDPTGFGLASRVLAQAGLILLLALLALGWAVFYHPMALLVAGWTESLKSVLNPLVGLDTIRHMGPTYFKAFAMYLVVQAASLVLTLVVGVVTAPFNLPLVGNLPATFLSGVVTFYTSLVIACLLGLSLFKSADRLGIEIG